MLLKLEEAAVLAARKFRAALFDLDGVIVDTAKYHYLAWKKLAAELGFDFRPSDNERLKGVSRDRSLEILLELGGFQERFTPAERADLAARKTAWYIEYIAELDATDLLPGARDCVTALRTRGIKTALCTASKNSPLILERLEIASWFDAVVDGNRVTKAKPDPEVFLTAANDLGIAVEGCVVFEDARAGIEAAKRAGMYAVGVGNERDLREADTVLPSLYALHVDELF
jgi:beta-phosphoglucomutase